MCDISGIDETDHNTAAAHDTDSIIINNNLRGVVISPLLNPFHNYRRNNGYIRFKK